MVETTGNKDDAGKLRYGLVLGGMVDSIKAVVELAEIGAKRYGDNNWQNVEDGAERYKEALQRHLIDELKYGPGATDHDTNVLQATAIAWNALAYLWFILKGKY